jgi:hypothetical protein
VLLFILFVDSVPVRGSLGSKEKWYSKAGRRPCWVRKIQENAAKSKQAWVDTAFSSRQTVNGMEEIC